MTTIINPFDKVLDSSIWQPSSISKTINHKDTVIRVGIVRTVLEDKVNKRLRYNVDVRYGDTFMPCICQVMVRFGGVYNYEEYSLSGYKPNPLAPKVGRLFGTKAGDFVLVALINGVAAQGIILGGVAHQDRTSKLKLADGPTYASEFNGMETLINKDGEYILTHKGLPTNIASLKAPAGKKVVAPIYNKTVGNSFIKFDKTGGIEIGDKATSKPQSIKIDKKGGKMEVKSGSVSIIMDKAKESIDLKSKKLTMTIADKIEMKTKEYQVGATKTVKIKAPKIAIGSGSVELLDQLIKIIDALGKLKPVSPTGPCTPLMADPGWPDVLKVKTDLTKIKGSL